MKTILSAFIFLLSTQSFASQKLMHQARNAFENKKFEKAISIYNKVSKDSDLWGVAIEEKAWAHLHLNQTAEVLAQTKTLTHFPLNQLGHYEAYLIQALTELKTCRYEDSFKTLEKFKKDKMPRIQALENLTQSSVAIEVTQKLIENHRSQKIKSQAQLGSLVTQLPQFVHLDKRVQAELSKKSPNLTKLSNRLQTLANQELEDIKKVVTKLKLIEVESEQRVVRDAVNGFNTAKNGEFKKTDYNQLIFPADDQPWIDELGQFEVAMNTCLKQRRKL